MRESEVRVCWWCVRTTAGGLARARLGDLSVTLWGQFPPPRHPRPSVLPRAAASMRAITFVALVGGCFVAYNVAQAYKARVHRQRLETALTRDAAMVTAQDWARTQGAVNVPFRLLNTNAFSVDALDVSAPPPSARAAVGLPATPTTPTLSSALLSPLLLSSLVYRAHLARPITPSRRRRRAAAAAAAACDPPLLPLRARLPPHPHPPRKSRSPLLSLPAIRRT